MKDTCLSSLKLSLSLLEDELSQKERADLQAHLSGCARCRERLTDLKREREALYQKRPSLDLAAERPRLRWRLALSAACACLLLASGLWLFRGGEDRPGGVIFKGETPTLSFRVEQRGHVSAGRSHMQLQPGDRIRFAYSIGENAFLIIVNLDDDGQVTVYYPSGGGDSQAIRAGQEVFLPGSIRLDDYIGKERIFAVFTREPIRVSDLESAASRAWEQEKDIEKIETLPVDGYQVTIPIIKVKDDG